MISIVISEKGGVERRENYDQSEITVGRVKGNDVLLPKGNVSKRHARLIVRDGRYIVTDLKSTNGTYVNHRRITHATLVREGDRIYIGDFVLRIEAPGEETDSAEATATHSSMPDPEHEEEELAAQRLSNQVTAAPPLPDRNEVVSHFPIEHDPDESLASSGLPAPPPIPSGLRDHRRAPIPIRSHAPTPARLYRRPSGELVASYGADSSSAATTTGTGTGFPTSADNRRDEHNTFLRELLLQVEEQVGNENLAVEKADTDLAQKVEDALTAAADTLRDSQAKAAAMPWDELKQVAREELLELGPLTRILDDESIRRIRVWRRHVTVTRAAGSGDNRLLNFGTDAGVERALLRLSSGSGLKLDANADFIEAKDIRGFQLRLLRPPVAPDGPLLTLKRKQLISVNLDSLVRQGTLSRGMAKLLERCIQGRGSVLVVGGVDCGVAELMHALCATRLGRPTRLWLCNDTEESTPPDVSRVVLGATDSSERGQRMNAALQMDCEGLVLPPGASDLLPSVLDQLAATPTGLIAAVCSNSLNRGIEALVAQLAKRRPELNPATARQWLLSGFDLAVEVSCLRDGRSRITRLSELRPDRHPALRDIFHFRYERTVTGGAIEGNFTSTGLVPRIVADLNARGFSIDTGLFRKQGV